MIEIPTKLFYFIKQGPIISLTLNLKEVLYCKTELRKKSICIGDRDLILIEPIQIEGVDLIRIYTTPQVFDIEINNIPPVAKDNYNLLIINKNEFMALPRFKVDYAHSYATQDQIAKVEGKVSEVVELQMSTDAKQNEYLEKVYTSLNENGNADAILASAVAEYAAKNQEAVKSLQETLHSLSSKQEAITEDITGFYEDTKSGFEAIQGARVTTLK